MFLQTFTSYLISTNQKSINIPRFKIEERNQPFDTYIIFKFLDRIETFIMNSFAEICIRFLPLGIINWVSETTCEQLFFFSFIWRLHRGIYLGTYKLHSALLQDALQSSLKTTFIVLYIYFLMINYTTILWWSWRYWRLQVSPLMVIFRESRSSSNSYLITIGQI